MGPWLISEAAGAVQHCKAVRHSRERRVQRTRILCECYGWVTHDDRDPRSSV